MEATHERLLVSVLLALTFVTGIIDAVSFLALGQVFTANMTGTVALLGFASLAAGGFSLAAARAARAPVWGSPRAPAACGGGAAGAPPARWTARGCA